jgi:hypothetical protein
MLVDLGFRPDVDSDGDIRFTYEGGKYFITDNCDDSYFFLMYPGFWKFESKDEQIAGLLAANATNRQVKTATVLVNKDMTHASITVECFVGEPSDVRSFLMRSLRCVQQAVSTFRDEMRSILG